MTDYDKQIEVKKKELAAIKASIPPIMAERDKIIKEGNTIIFDNKAKAEKIVADATAKAEEIVGVASKVKAEATDLMRKSEDRSKELDEKEKVHVEACKAIVKAQEKLAQDKIDFGKQQAEKLARVDAAIEKARELLDVIAGFSKTINIKIAEIAKI